MSDEAAFLRAIQADPSDATAKLVYADWLDEHGETEKAEYVRTVAESGRRPTVDVTPPRAVELRGRLPDTWLLVLHGRVPLWDEVTMFALGRLQGVLAALEMCSNHAADIGYDFTAQLVVRTGELQDLADRHYGPHCQPVRLEHLGDWKAELKSALRANLLMELGQVTGGSGTRLALQVDYGRDAVVDAAFRSVTGVITPTAGWRVHITEKQWYAIAWTDLILEAADRVLFLHFSFSD
jgi:uncharacterized protein (TIGR02996 family)